MMSKFNVGDIVAKFGSPKLFKVTFVFEGFYQAKPAEEFSAELHKKRRIRTIHIDDADSTWNKITKTHKAKFKMDEKVFFTINNRWSNDDGRTFVGTVTSSIAELANAFDLSSFMFFYVIQGADNYGTHVALEENIFKNLNHNNVWNNLLENSK